jgi:hypothetical protein
MSHINVSYTLTPLPSRFRNLEDALVYNATLGTSAFDLIIAYHTVTPARLAFHDFSVALSQADNTVIVKPGIINKQRITLIDGVVRRSVVYMFAVIGVVAGIMALMILVFELPDPQSDIRGIPLWRRPLWAAEMGLEVVLTAGTSEKLHNPISRSFRSLGAIIGIFLLAIFGGVITSKLTAASIASIDFGVTELRGNTIVVSSETLRPFLEGLQVGAKVIRVADLNKFAVSWVKGAPVDDLGNPINCDGISTATDVIKTIYRDENMEPLGFLKSLPYTLGGVGAGDLKAMPMSRLMDPTLANLFNQQLQYQRENGMLADLFDQYIPSDPDPGVPDIVIPAETKLAVETTAIVFYSVYGFIVLLLLIAHLVTKGSDSAESGDGKSTAEPVRFFGAPTKRVEEGELSNSHIEFCWRGKKFSKIGDRHMTLINSIVQHYTTTKVHDEEATQEAENGT